MNFLADILIEVIIYAIVGYNLYPLVICLWQTFVTPKLPSKKAYPLDPTSPASSWVNITHAVTTGSASDRRRQIDRCSTVPQLFGQIVKQYSGNRCFGYRPVLSVDHEIQPDGQLVRKFVLNDDYKWLTYEEVDTRMETVAVGLSAVGVKRKDLVMIYADTCLEWMVCCQAVWRLGASLATLYTNLGDEGIAYGINETQVTHLVTSREFLAKLAPLIDRLPNIQCIIYMDYNTDNEVDDSLIGQLFTDSQRQRITFYSFIQMESMGEQLSPDLRSSLLSVEQSADDTAILMYTSGSTGSPKAVMISHKNLLFAVKAFQAFASELTTDDTYSAFLPLAHCLEICAEISFLSVGVPVGYASVHTLTDRSLGLKSGSKGDLTILRPTVIAAVPLILDRIMKAITDEMAKRSHLIPYLFNGLLKYKNFWIINGFTTPVINYFICHKFANLLGGRVKIIASGGAPLRPSTHLFIRNLFDVKVLQGYGLTETTASATITTLDDESVGRVGPPMDGVRIRLVDWTDGGYGIKDLPVPRGELVIGGDCVTNGYYKNPILTDQYFKVENGVKWFYTGDIAQRYPDGSYRIIDRKKDIIKLSNGEYVSLSNIEEKLKFMPYVDNICVYANSLSNSLIALIVPNCKQLKGLAQSLSKSPEMNVKQLCDDIDLKDKINDMFKKFCLKSGLTKVEIPTKIKLCPEEWSPTNGLVTASFKLKRKAIQEYYDKDIKQLFAF